jgi:hypothetical protein
MIISLALIIAVAFFKVSAWALLGLLIIPDVVLTALVFGNK